MLFQVNFKDIVYLTNQSTVNGHLSCFQFFNLTNNTPVNIFLRMHEFPLWARF